MTIRRCTACKRKDHKFKDCDEKWRRTTYINLDVVSTIVDIITTNGDLKTLRQVWLCSKLFKSVVDDSIVHFLTNGKGPTALRWMKHFCRLLVTAQLYRTGASSFESQNSMTFCCIFSSISTNKHCKSKYWLFLTYGDIRYYEFVRKYPGASKKQFVRHKDMIWESYTKGQKDVYDFMIKALWGTYFFQVVIL